MARQVINIGTTANDGTGDTLRAGGTKINDNFSEVYGQVKHLNHYMITGEANPSHNAFVRLAAAIQDGDTVYIDAGTHILLSQITISGRNGLTFRLSRHARIKLGQRAWNVDGARCGIAFHDCSNLTIDGGIWDQNGVQNNSLNTDARGGQVSMLAVVSNVAPTSETVQSRNINIRNCRFEDLFMTGLSLRLTEDAVVENCSFTDPGYERTRFVNDAPYMGLALAHRTRVLNCSFLGGYNANHAVGQHPHEYAGIVASVGQGAGSHPYRTLTDQGRYKPFGNVAALEWTAPASGTAATVSWSSLAVWSADFTVSEMKFLHLTKNRNTRHDISPGRLNCTAIDNTAKTISFALRNLIGATTNPVPAFAGQTMVTFGYRPAGMMKDLTIEGCYFRHMGSAGVFLWGVDGYVLRGNTCVNCRDIGLDAEFSVNGVITGNTLYSTNGYTVSSGISILELGHNVSITGNTIRLHAPLYGINIETGGPIISNIAITGNSIVGGDIRLRGGGNTGAGCNIGYVTISNNTIDAIGADGATAMGANIQMDTIGVCRDIVIRDNSLLNSAAAPIAYSAVDGLTIMGNNITHTQWNGIADEGAISNVNTSRRVVIANNILHDTGQGWRDGYGLLRRRGATSTEAPRFYGNFVSTASGNVDYSVNPPYVSAADTAIPPVGPPALQVGTIMIRDNGGTLEKSTNADHPADTGGTWTAV